MRQWKTIGHRTISFGKIDYNGGGRKINEVEIELTLRESEDERRDVEFTACGGVWNSRKTDYVCCGQMIDDPYVVEQIRVKRDLYLEIMDLWSKHHCNCGKYCTPRQEEELNKRFGCWYAVPYEKRKEYLESIGMLKDEYEGVEYAYGEEFVPWRIPEEDLARIREIIAKGE